MKVISDKELLQLQLDILRDVDTFCRHNGIEYFLVGGTGIGAIRHGGYIPWDDDIDIGMTRPNYNRFISSFNGTFPNLRVYAPEINWEYYAPYANVCDTRTLLIESTNSHRKDEIGVKIDVFPYDGVPSDPIEFENLRRKARRLKSMSYFKRSIIKRGRNSNPKAIISNIIWKILLLPIPFSYIQKRIHELSELVSYEEAVYLEKIVFPYKKNIPQKKELFESYCDMPFENLTVRNLKDYDVYLKSVFGDYMKLPPENQRVANHGFVAYWKES